MKVGLERAFTRLRSDYSAYPGTYTVDERDADLGEIRLAFENAQEEIDRYRVEADECIGEYDSLELDARIMREALEKIATKRNQKFDPWAVEVAAKALADAAAEEER